MEFDLEIFQGEAVQYLGEYAFAPVLRKAALRCLGDVAKRGRLELILEQVLDEQPYPGPPLVHNLSQRFGRCRLRLIQDGKTVREQPLRVVDLFGPVLAEELRQLRPNESQWWFQLRQRRMPAVIIVGDALAGLTDLASLTDLAALSGLSGESRPAPPVKGSVDVDPSARGHQPFTLTPMAAEVEPARPEELGLPPERLKKINILMSADIHDEMLQRMTLSNRMEEGGFLLGRVTRAGEEAHLVEITHITPASRSGAGAIHFTFTGESFLAAAQLLEERGRDEQLVGWYHTHLFGVDVEMGLSTIDIDLHLATFQQPWQVAGLINIERGRRVLRFYGRDDKTLREYEQWISDDSGKYSPATRALGGH